MTTLYQDLLEGFKEIGELEGNSELVETAEALIEEENVKAVQSTTQIIHPIHHRSRRLHG